MPGPSSKVEKKSKSLESKVSSEQLTEEMGSKDSDRCEQNSTEGKHWYELLKEKIGFDINAKKWMEEHPELASKNKSELLIRLACEVCLAKNTEYDPENENEEQNNKYIRFDTQRIFALFEVANPLIDPSDRKNFVEFICQKGNVQLLEMICKQESKDLKEGCKVERQYKWQGTFTGYSKLIDLLQYVIDNRCSPEIVLCLAEKMYGCAHIFYNGEQYLEPRAVASMKNPFKCQDSVAKELLKQVIKLGYKDTVSVMLSGDIYHSIRLIKWKVFKEKPESIAAYNMIKEAVADVINSWMEGCKDYVLNLLDQGIEIDLHKMGKENIIFQLEYLGKKVKDKDGTSKEKLVKELEGLGKKKGEVRLRSIVVGALISTLFFKHQDKLMKDGPFTLKITLQDNSKKEKILKNLNKKISKGESIEETVLELIKLLHLGNHITNNWFFREVLAKVVNENLDKLKAVCAAICKEPMQELLKGEEVHEDVRGVLQFFGVEVLTNQTVRTEIPSSSGSIADYFAEDVKVYCEKEAKEDCSSDELAFSGLTRKIIRDLEEKKDLTDEEKKALISKALSEIKKGINILADKTAVKIDVKDIFISFELINSKIKNEQKREIVELACQKGNVQLLEMICKKESSKSLNYIERQYKWQGTFTGYSKLIDLLQYVIDNRCSPEIVLCLAEKMYGCAHIFYNGEQYLEPRAVASMKNPFKCQDSVAKELLKQVIKLGYKDTVSVMLSGDIYHSIRLIKWKVFKEKPESIAAYNMIKEAVADVISSWVENEESCKDDLRRLLDQGIEIDLHKMGKENIIFQLEYLGKKVKDKDGTSKEKLVKELEGLGKKKGEVRLRSIVVGALISTLFFKHQDKLMKDGPFTLKITHQDNSKKEKILKNLNKKISKGESIEETVLELIKLLHLGNHITNNWFFREVLAKVVNENLDKLKAVCAAICKEPMQELLKGEEVHEDVRGVLQFFGVEVLTNQTVRTEIPSSSGSIADYFAEDVKVYCEKEAKEDCSSDELAFSGLTRKIIRDLEEKKDLTDEEKKALISKALSEIKKGINILADKTAVKIDVKDIFISFELINSKIKNEQKREIVELACQKGNAQLLEMICKQESKDLKEGCKVERQYKWQGTFTGYSGLIDLLQYVIDSRCSPEIVLCLAKKIYGCAHIFWNGKQYLDSFQVQQVKASFNYQDSVVKELLKQAIKLGYKDTVSVMLSGDIYHSIRLMKWQKFQEKPEFIAAYNMIKETVADVINSWMEGCKDYVLNLLDQGIEIDLHKMGKENIIFQLEYLGKEVKNITSISKEKLVKELEGLGKKKGEVRLRSIVVGALISTLFFKHQDKLMKDGPFTLKITHQDNSKKEKILKNLNKKISKGESIEETVLELIKLLHLGNHITNNWFFREVLAKVVNENLDKLKAVCAAICKEPMQELLKGEEVHEDVRGVLQFFGVDTPSLKRDLGSVESQETFEYTDSSSTTETNKLSSQNIVDIAKYYYKWMEPINGKYLEGMNEKVFFTCTDISSLEDKLKHYKKIQQKDLIFTSIINTGREHWVTLVVARNVQGKDVAYYCDSFGKKEIPSVLKKALKIDTNCIGISQIKQHKDEYNCGIFALANAYKITGIIKDKSITEINVELKSKLDPRQLRKEFAEKVEEMRQKSSVDSEHDSAIEVVQIEGSVDALSSQQPSTEIFHDLPEVSIAGPSRVKVLSSVLPDLKAAERKNEEFVKNDCRHKEDIWHTKEHVSVFEASGSVFSNRKVIGGSVLGRANWGKSNRRSLSGKRTPQIIKFSVPEFSDFVSMFDKDFQNNLLKYEFDYERLDFLFDNKGESSDEQSYEEGDELDLSGLSLEEYRAKEAAVNEYREAVTCLMNGEREEAVSQFSKLADKGMPHAQYALAIIWLKDLWLGKINLKEDPDLDKKIDKMIGWLNSDDQDENLRPLNRSLLLKILLYDIGGCGAKVKGEKLDLLNRVLYVTRGTTIKFTQSSFEGRSMITLGAGLENFTQNQINDCDILLRCAMYEILKGKMLSKDVHKERSAIEDTFSKICKPLPNLKKKFEKMFKQLYAEMIYGRAVNLLIHNQGSEDGKNREKAVNLLEESFQLGHLGASYLLGTLLYKKSGFNFIFDDGRRRYIEYFSNLEKFATSTHNKTALCIVANEYLKNWSRIVAQNKEKAQEILEEAGYESIWKEASAKLSASPSPFQFSAEDSPLRRAVEKLNLVGSSPVTKRQWDKADFSPQSPGFERFTVGRSFSGINQASANSVVGKGDMRYELISNFCDLPKDQDIIEFTQKCVFYAKKHCREDSNFRDIEEYCKQKKWDEIIKLCDVRLSTTTDTLVKLKAYYNKGEALYAQGRDDDARRIFEKLQELSKKPPEFILAAAYSIAKINVKSGKYDDAISVLRNAKSNVKEVEPNFTGNEVNLIGNIIELLSAKTECSSYNAGARKKIRTSMDDVKLERYTSNDAPYK